MKALVVAMAVVVLGQTIYHTAARGAGGERSVFALIAVAYVVALLATVLVGFLSGELPAAPPARGKVVDEAQLVDVDWNLRVITRSQCIPNSLFLNWSVRNGKDRLRELALAGLDSKCIGVFGSDTE